MRRKVLNALVGSASVLCGAPWLHAAPIAIYQDNFDGTAGTVAGRTPDIASGQDGGSTTTWTSDAATSANPDSIWTATGGTYTTPDSTAATLGTLTTGADANLITNSYLPFVPQGNQIYDLHIDLLASSAGASGNWLGLAFATAGLNTHTLGGGSSGLSNDATYGLTILKGTGAVQIFAGSGTGNGQTGTSVTAGAWTGIDIYLNTIGTQWTESWAINGTTVGTGYTFSTNPSIGDVIFGSNKITGEASNFSLTAVPEPASLWAIGLGAFGLIRRRPRQI